MMFAADTDIWRFQPHPEVWLLIAGAVFLAWYAVRVIGPHAVPAGTPIVTRRNKVAYVGAIATLWIASDWPIGALGSGYLMSVHTIQYLLYCMIAPPLLWLGVPRWSLLATEVSFPRLWRVLRFAAQPLVALLLFNAILLGSHTPAVIDGIRPSQLGSFGVDMLWLVGGLALWWPVLAPCPEIGRMGYALKAGYLFLATVLPTIPAAFLVFAEFPLYELYELAPRVDAITARQDQLLAGIIMKIGGDVVMWTAMITVFIRWARHERRLEQEEQATTRAERPA